MPSTRFLFWNINRKPLQEQVASLAEEHRADIVVLAECDIKPAALLRTLNRGGSEYHFAPGNSKAVTVFTRFSGAFLRPTFESDRVSIRRLVLPERLEILVTAVHLPSKLRWSQESQILECAELSKLIARIEDQVGHRRTILLGDLNMNPFEAGIVGAAGLHATMSRRVADRRLRTVQGREYHFFYNPMWQHLGDRSGNTAGSYYYDRSEQVNYFWNVFDQVLLRPELAQGFDSEKLRIIGSVGSNSLTRPDGRPNGQDFSDHLPITFALEF